MSLSKNGAAIPGSYRLAKPVFFIAITLFAFLIRFIWFPFAARDYEVFLLPWYKEIEAGGGFLAIGQAIGDYLPSYIYILAFLTYLPINSLYAIKLVSFIGDIVLAAFAMRIVDVKTRQKNLMPIVYTAIILLPTMWLNSGVWGQCDSLYTAALVASVSYFLCGKSRPGMIAYSIAFIFKLQAIFLAPLILLLWIKRKTAFRQLLYVPAAYIAVMIPAAFAGRSIWDLLTIYFRLVGSYSALSMGAPNFYAFVEPKSTLPFSICGILAFAMIMILLFRHLWKTNFEVTQDVIFRFAMLSALMVPFLLPHMHERYFYLADVMSVLYAFVYPKRWYIPLTVVSSSVLVYSHYLFGASWARAAYATLPMFCALCIVFCDFMKTVNATNQSANKEKEQQ